MTHSCMWHDLFVCVTWLIHGSKSKMFKRCLIVFDMTHLYVFVYRWHESFIDMWHDSFDMTHSYMWHDSFDMTHFIWFIRICDMTHSYMWHDLFVCVTWLIHIWGTWFMRDSKSKILIRCLTDIYTCDMTYSCICDMTHSYIWHDSFIYVTWPVHMWHDLSIRDTWLIQICDMTYS